jgi:hypothetical protein
MSDRKRIQPATPPTATTSAPTWRERAVRLGAGIALNGIFSFMTLVAAMMLAFAGLLLTVAWHSSAQVMQQRQLYRTFTAHAEGRIVESWLALQIDPQRITVPANWRASTLATPCVVVEVDGEWSADRRRAFCGNSFGFSDAYDVVNLRDIAPDTPFAWPRDSRGFAVAEIRMSAESQAWLASHAPNRFMHDKWPAQTALDWLKLEVDAPVDAAIDGWTAPSALMPIVFDPRQPALALPKGVVDARLARHPNWIVMIIVGAMGLAVWAAGILLLPVLNNTPLAGKIVLGVLPLLALPWWEDYFPHSLTAFNRDLAQVVGDMFHDIDPLDRVVASPPGDALLAHGTRVTWRAGDGAYADTFGRFTFAAPASVPASADAALAALVGAVTPQIRALPEAERIALMQRLRRDKELDLTAAGIVFLPAAKEALVDPQSSPALARAARLFLATWLTSPVASPHQRQPAYDERVRLFAQLKDVPVPEIANRVR